MERDHLITDLAQLVGQITEEEIDPNRPETKLVEDLGADSMDIVDICDRIEAKFEIKVDDEDVQKVKTFGELADLVENKQTKV